jgi:hypothetical protein
VQSLVAPAVPRGRVRPAGTQVMESEELLAALDATKKHLDNKEFVAAVQRQKQARGAGGGSRGPWRQPGCS